MNHKPVTELLQEIEDLFFNSSISQSEAVQALVALQQTYPEEFDSEVLSLIQNIPEGSLKGGFVRKKKQGEAQVIVGEVEQGESPIPIGDTEVEDVDIKTRTYDDLLSEQAEEADLIAIANTLNQEEKFGNLTVQPPNDDTSSAAYKQWANSIRTELKRYKDAQQRVEDLKADDGYLEGYNYDDKTLKIIAKNNPKAFQNLGYSIDGLKNYLKEQTGKEYDPNSQSFFYGELSNLFDYIKQNDKEGADPFAIGFTSVYQSNERDEDYRLKKGLIEQLLQDPNLSDEDKEYLQQTFNQLDESEGFYDDLDYEQRAAVRDRAGDLVTNLKANSMDAVAKLLKAPTFFNKMSIIQTEEGKAFIEALEAENLPPNEEAARINEYMAAMNIQSGFGGGVLDGKIDFGILKDIQLNTFMYELADALQEDAELMREATFQFETEINDDFSEALKNGDVAGFVDAISRTSQSALESIPSIIQAMLPYVGIPSIFIGEAAGTEDEANKAAYDALKELTKLDPKNAAHIERIAQLKGIIERGNLDNDLIIHSLVSGGAEGLLEVVTKKIGGKMFRNLAGVPKETSEKAIKDIVLNIIKDSGGEGLSEGATEFIKTLSSYAVMGDEEAFMGFWGRFVDAYLIGSFTGGGMTTIGDGSAAVRNVIVNNKINNAVSSTNTGDVANLFDPNISETDTEVSADDIVANQIVVSQLPGANQAIDKSVDNQVEAGNMTTEKGTEIKNNVRNIQGAVNVLKPLSLDSDPEAVRLAIERKGLQNKIDNAKQADITPDEADVNRVNEITERLSEMSKSKRIKSQIIIPGITNAQDLLAKAAGIKNIVDPSLGVTLPVDSLSKPKKGKDEDLGDGINETLLGTIKDPNSKKADINQATDALIENNKALYYNAVGFNPERGDISGKAVMDAIRPRLGPIIKNFDPSKGVTWSTYVTDSLNKKRQEIYNEAGIGQQNISLDAEGARQVADTTTEQDTQQDVPQRSKVYPSQLEAVAKVLTPEVRETQNAKVKDEIIRSINDKGVNPKTVATDLISKTREKEIRNVIKGAVGRFGSPEYNQFVDDVVNQDFINSLPLSTIKGRFGKLFGIEEISRTPTKNVREGKKDSNFKKQVFRIPKTTPETIQKIKDYFKANEKRSQSLFSLLAEGAIVEEVQTMRGDTEFMNKLNDVLELKGSDINAEQFMDQLQKDADQRTKEDTSLDVVEDVLDSMIQGVDSYIDSMKGTLSANPITPAARAVKAGLKVFKTVYQKTKSIAKAINAAVNEIYTKLKGEVSKADIKSTLESEITQENVDNNSVDIDSIIDKFAEKLGVNRGIAYENAVYDAARKVKNALFKVIGVQTEREGAADFRSEIAGNDFIVELKLDPAKLGSVKFNINSDGSITLAKDNVKSKEASKIASEKAGKNVKVVIEKDYTFKDDLQKAVAKNKKNIKRFRDRAEELGQDMKDFDEGIINKDIYNQLKKEGLLNDARSTITMPVDMVTEIYQKKQPKPTDYINVKGKGLFSFNNTLDLPIDPVTGTVEVNVGYTTSGTIYNTVDGKKVDTGNRRFFFRAEPFKFNDLGKSKHNIDTEAGINKLLNTPSVQILADAQKAKSKIANTASEIVSDKDSTRKVKDVLDKSQEARFKAQEVNKETKGLSAFDFDDTLALTKEKVLYTMPDGTTGSLTASEFAVQAEQLTAEGAEFDFSNFENVDISTLEGPMVGEAKKKQKKFGPKDIFVVTARPDASVDAIHTFLTSIGLNIPKENITGLGNGDPQAKADWFLGKAAEGYNDFYFSDDSLLNVQQVKNVLDQIDVKSEVQQAIANKKQTLDDQFNKQVEEVSGIKAGETVSDARALLEGKKKDGGLFKRFMNQFTITYSAEDFLGLLYNLAGKGAQGNRHLKFIKDNLIDPYNKAEQSLISAKMTVAADLAAIKKAFPTLKAKRNIIGIRRNPLNLEIGVGPYTKSHAVRVWMWNKQGMDIPGISKADVNALVAAVEGDLELLPFAENVLLIQKDGTYPAPGNYWAGGTIASDIIRGLDTTYRGKLLTEWKQNVDIVFSDKNMNKLESIFGSKYVEALRDSISRMKRGSNRPIFIGSGARQVNTMLDWLNASVGNVMFLNMRSGLLQLISNVNFINWGDNNIYNASKAFASKEYVPTVMKLMNSDYLVNRRDGLKINVNEAELTEAATKGGVQGMISYLLDKGFVITRIMDSLAIATGGATFFINRKNTLLNRTNEATGKKYTDAEAEQQAFDDFYAIAEETQQSSNPSKISTQQASYFGRVFLAFQNVTMQYNRKTKKSIRDLYNRRQKPGMTQRESDLSNMSSILYYVGVQNLIFNGLQQALFATAFDDEEEEAKDEERTKSERTARIANGMLDSLLNGLGFGGAIISTAKNVGLRVLDESQRKSPKYIDAVDEIFNVSPVIDAKVRKLKSAAKTFEWNMKEIKKKGWDLENPAYLAVSQIVSAFTNVPVDRALRKMMNIAQAFDEETKTWQRIALIMGWSGWNLNLPYWGLESTIKQEEEKEEKLKEKFKSDVQKAKKNGFTKRVPFTGKNSWQEGIPKGLKEGEDYIGIKRYDGIIQYYKKP